MLAGRISGEQKDREGRKCNCTEKVNLDKHLNQGFSDIGNDSVFKPDENHSLGLAEYY